MCILISNINVRDNNIGMAAATEMTAAANGHKLASSTDRCPHHHNHAGSTDRCLY